MVSPWRDFAAMQERREQGQRTAPWERRLNLLKLETGSALTFLKLDSQTSESLKEKSSRLGKGKFK